MGANLSFRLEDCIGTVEVSERGEDKDSSGLWWKIIELVEKEDEEVSLSIDVEDGKFSVAMDAYQILNEETGRAFNTGLAVRMSKGDLEALHKFIGLLLSLPSVTGESDSE